MYQTLMIDPPWSYDLRRGSTERRNIAVAHYGDMTFEEIADLPIAEWSDPKGCFMWLWVTNNHFEDGFKLLRHWGYTQKTILTWVKTTNDGTRPRIGTGHWLRNCTEHCIGATRGGLHSFSHAKTLGALPTVLYEPEMLDAAYLLHAPRREHSRKPDGAYDLAEALQPEARRLEVFSRCSRAGWTAWGDEVGKFDRVAGGAA